MFKNTIFHAFTKICERDHFFTPLCTGTRVPAVHWQVVACKGRLRAKWNLDFPAFQCCSNFGSQAVKFKQHRQCFVEEIKVFNELSGEIRATKPCAPLCQQ